MIDDSPYRLETRAVEIIRCVDAYINDYYKGTHCWSEMGGGAGIHLPVGAIPSKPYTPNGYPPSYSGGFGSGGGGNWVFEFRRLQSIIGNVTGLNLLEKDKLATVLEKFTVSGVASVYSKFNKFIVDKKMKVNFTIGPTINSVDAQYDRSNKTITYNSINSLHFTSTVEEFVHVIQDQYFYNNMGSVPKNCEFEAKVFADLSNYLGMAEGHEGVVGLIGTAGQTPGFENKYSLWISEIVLDRGACFTGRDAATFMELCSEWTGDNGKGSPSFDPRLLRHFFNKPIKFD